MKSRLPLFTLTNKLCLLVLLLSASHVQSEEKNDFFDDSREKPLPTPNTMKESVCGSNWFLKLLERNLSQSLLPVSNKDIDSLIWDVATAFGEKFLGTGDFHTNDTDKMMEKLLESIGFWSANTKYTPDHKMYDEIWNSFTWRDPKKGFSTSKNAQKFITQLHAALHSSRRGSELSLLMNYLDQPLNFDHDQPRFQSFLPSKSGENIFSSIELSASTKKLIPRGMSVVKAIEETQNMIFYDRKKLKYSLRELNVRTLNLRLINETCQSFKATIPPIIQKTGVLAVVCGEPLRQAKVVGGKKATQGSWPWMVFLKISQNDSLTYGGCGGSLISDMHVLTAAHCVVGSPAENVRVYYSSFDLDKMNYSSGYEAENVFVHEDFNKQGFLKNDIALIKLKEKVTFDFDRRPICLPPSNITLDGKILYMAGWGKTTENGTTSNVLLEGTSFIWETAECNKVWIPKFGNSLISEQQICMGGDGKADVCQGDSGGPIMYQTASGQWTVVGIASWGFGCSRVGFPSVSTRASTYLDWINAKLML